MATGAEVVAAIVRGQTWDTAEDVNVANAGWLLRQVPLGTSVGELLIDDSLGFGFASGADRGNATLSGDVPCFARYDSLNLQIALCMGIAADPVQLGTTAAYEHVFTLADTLDGYFATFAVDKTVSVWEYPSVKFGGFSLRGQAGQPIEMTFPVIASRSLVTSGQTNTDLSSVTFITQGLRLMYHHGVMRINQMSGGALQDSDRVYPSQFEINFRRPMEGDFVMNGARVIDEPTQTGFPTFDVTLTFPVYRNNTLIQLAEAETPMKMDLTFTSPQLAGTGYPYLFRIEIPRLELAGPTADVTGPGKIPLVVRAQGVVADTAPAGMTGLTRPLRVTVRNQRTTNALT